MYTPKANPKQKHVEKTQEHEKGALLLNNSPRGRTYSQWRARLLVVASTWRANTALCHTSSAVVSRWRENTALCHVVARRGEQITRIGEL